MAKRPAQPAPRENPRGPIADARQRQAAPAPAAPPQPPAPWHPAPWKIRDARALQAVAGGTATAEQAKHALDFVVFVLCGTYDFPYRPSGDRDTTLALGRMFVGQQIVKLTKLNLNAIRRNADNEQSDEPPSEDG